MKYTIHEIYMYMYILLLIHVVYNALCTQVTSYQRHIITLYHYWIHFITDTSLQGTPLLSQFDTLLYYKHNNPKDTSIKGFTGPNSVHYRGSSIVISILTFLRSVNSDNSTHSDSPLSNSFLNTITPCLLLLRLAIVDSVLLTSVWYTNTSCSRD